MPRKDSFQAQPLPMQVSCIVAVAVAIFITVESFKLDYPIMPFMALTAALLGWMVGILASPTTKQEKDQFGELAKVVAGFVSGYLLSKIDPLVATLLNPEHGEILNPLVAMRVLVALSSFFATLVTVFAVRLFWKWGDSPDVERVANGRPNADRQR